MGDTRLVRPSVLYKESFLDFVQDVKDTGYESYPLHSKSEINFGEFLTELGNLSDGINLPEGWVPCSNFWLVDDIDEVIGTLRVRHRVDTAYLKTLGHIGYEIKSSRRGEGNGSRLLLLGLIEAGKIGIDKVLVNCAENNLASKRIIEKADGKYLDSFVSDGAKYLQYEISIV